MTDPNKQIPRFLKEEPSDTDIFKGGGHQRTAVALIDFIKSDQDIGIIGLEGDLGSGKSTVVQLVKNSLEKANHDLSAEGADLNSGNMKSDKKAESDEISGERKYQLLTFDLDKHSHSSIRKALIVALHGKIEKLWQDRSSIRRYYFNCILRKQTDSIFRFIKKINPASYESLTAKKIVKYICYKITLILTLIKFDKYHSVGLEKLDNAKFIALGRKLDFQRKTNSEMNWWLLPFAISFAISVKYMLEAVVNVFNTLHIRYSPELEYNFDLENTLTTIAGFSVLIVVLSKYVIDIFRSRNSGKVSVIDLYKKNGRDNIVENVRVDNDIHSFELKKALDEFIDIIPGDTTLVLVIDNIDRVESRLVQEVWSDLNIISSISNAKFKVILPYSEVKLAKALSDEDDDYSITGREYVSKRLPIVFRAPPIITADWRMQFESYWKESIWFIKGYKEVSELIDIWSPGNTPVTPRFLKRLINDIATSYVGCPEEDIHGLCFAFYLLVYKSHRPNVTIYQALALRPELDKSGGSKVVDDGEQELKEWNENLSKTNDLMDRVFKGQVEWPEEVTCINYQANKEISFSELLEKPIAEAINTKDTKSILELSLVIGFDIYFKRVIESFLPEELYDLACDVSAWMDREPAGNWLDKYLPEINYRAANSQREVKLNSFKNMYPLKRAGYTLSYVRVQNEFDDYEFGKKPIDDKAIQHFYDCSVLLDKKPSVIYDPPADFFYEYLWPLRNKLKLWDIESIVMDQSLKKGLFYKLKNSYYMEERIPMDADMIAWFNSKNRIGDKALNDGMFKKIDFLFRDSRGVEFFPNLEVWGKSESTKFLARYFAEFSEEMPDKMKNKWLSALLVHGIISGDLMAQNNKDVESVSVSEPSLWDVIKDEIVGLDFDENYLTFAPLEVIAASVPKTEYNEILIPALVKLFENDRIVELDDSMRDELRTLKVSLNDLDYDCSVLVSKLNELITS
ncbi:P-loop NTPase fold protein [Sessilibacter corallicola]|uniref:P-loop NTPase fold protein n=1 Tax=Sessilibacter corallicola TaxID=2904075 RepID=UPI001E5C39A6|nr:P-loop NTPase fold protein [Sessilibacter corallicola]MCE2029825.1 KAP family NTPase [Sessilibacter corallicola]